MRRQEYKLYLALLSLHKNHVEAGLEGSVVVAKVAEGKAIWL
jgi:hypothetical protein